MLKSIMNNGNLRRAIADENLTYKVVLLVIIAVLLLGTAVCEAAYHAVICGISEYEDASVPNLMYSDDDAKDFSSYLRSYLFGWQSANIELLIDSAATKGQIKSAIERMGNRARPGDVCIFFFSGHGTTDLWGYECLAAYDYDSWWETGLISGDELGQWMADLPTDNYIVFLDACYSGAFTKSISGMRVKGFGSTVAEKGNRFIDPFKARIAAKDLSDNACGVVITACEYNEVCYDSEALENGVFSEFLLDAIKDRKADTSGDNNGRVAAEECYHYVRPRAIQYTAQNAPTVQYAQILDEHGGYLEFDGNGGRLCEDCEPEDADLGTIGTVVWGYSVSGNCGNGGKWVGQFVGEAGATYHFDLCPDSPGSGTANSDADIKITNGSCGIIPGAGEDGICSSPLYLPNDFQWTCPANGTYYVIIAPYDSSYSHTCEGDASDTFTLEYYSVKDEGDAYEPDNTAVQANEILPDSPQTHSIAPVGDVDYVRFSLDSESQVVIETSGLSNDTEMRLYDEQENEIDYDDDGGTGLFSRIERTTCGIDALSAGTYYVKVAEYGNNAKIDSYEIILTVTPCAGPSCPTTITSYPYAESFESDFGDWYEYHSTDVPKSIPDLGTTTSTLHVADSGTIVDLNVKLNITHTFDSDLDVFLIAPDATRIEFFTDVGSSGDNFSDTILDDEAAVPIASGSAPFAASYQPEGSLSDLDGKSITGTWTLEVTDDDSGISGTLNSWSLMVETAGGSGDWVNATDDDIDWTRNSSSTTSSGTGPSSAHDGTYYLYTEAIGSGYPNKQAILEGPCFDLSSLSNPELRFWYHMYGATMGTLTVEVSDNNCASWTPVWSISGNQGDSWYQAVIDLSAYSASTIKVRFAGVTGSSDTSDMAIDYVTLAESQLEAPLLHAEPDITPGLCNMISWDPVPDASEYYAECAEDVNFNNIDANSGWIPDTNYEFCSLQLGQTYWYRVKAWTPFLLKSWLQTSQVDFETDTLTDTRATADGNVVLAGRAGTPTLDTVGGTSEEPLSSTSEGYFNGFLATTGTTLTEIEVYLEISTSQSIEFLVYEGGALFSDQYNRIHSSTLVSSGTGAKFYSSGPVSVPLDAGKHYMIGAGHSDSLSIYYDWADTPLSFGIHAGYGNYMGSTSPEILPYLEEYPHITFYHRYTTVQSTGGYHSPGSIVSTAIYLPAEGNWGLVDFNTTTPADTELTVDILPAAGPTPIPGYENVSSGADLTGIPDTTVRLRANLFTTDTNNTPVLHNWSVTYTDPSFACESDWSNVQSSLQCDTLCDFDNNEKVNFADFAILAGQWLQAAGSPSADIAPEVPDGFVDFLDFSVFLENWLLDLTCTVEN